MLVPGAVAGGCQTQLQTVIRQENLLRMLKKLGNPWVALALILGFAQAYASRFFMTFDGISYLDMGDAYLRGDWHTAINGYWNPLFAWLQALAKLLFHPSPYWEYPLVHLVDYGIFAVTVFAFEFFLQGLLGDRKDVFAIRTISYSIFLWSSLELCRVFMVNPDMIIGACVYVALGIIVRAPKSMPIALGAALAVGFYAKAMMFPVSLLILLAACKVLPRRTILIASASFLLFCAPWIATLSLSTGHLTIGDTSRLNYSWYVNKVDERFWQGGPSRAGQPIHPARVVLESPRVFEFDGVFPVTFPIWYDESYWYRGLHMYFAPRNLAREYALNFYSLIKLLVFQGGGFLIGWVLCFFLRRDKTPNGGTRPAWAAWLISVASLLFFCAVHLEPRHIASLVAVLFLIPFTSLSGRISNLLASLIAVGGLVWAVSFASVTTLRGEPMIPFQVTANNDAWQLATDMQRLGVQPHEKLATVCCVGPRSVFWVHLMRAHIISQLDWNLPFWQLSGPDQQRVLTALASTGAKFAISEVPPPNPSKAAGWERVGESDFYLYPLSALAAEAPQVSAAPHVPDH